MVDAGGAAERKRSNNTRERAYRRINSQFVPRQPEPHRIFGVDGTVEGMLNRNLNSNNSSSPEVVIDWLSGRALEMTPYLPP